MTPPKKKIQLDMPNYGTQDELREKLLMAIHEGAEGFGFA